MSNDGTIATSRDNLEALVQRRLAGWFWAQELRVIVKDHGLILKGHVPTYYAKQLALHAAMDVSRLPILANEIEVQ